MICSRAGPQDVTESRPTPTSETQAAKIKGEESRGNRSIFLHFGRRETLHSSPDDDAFKVLDDLTRLLPLTFGTAGCDVGRSRFQRRASSEELESAARSIERHGRVGCLQH